jgi:hypothetical protein
MVAVTPSVSKNAAASAVGFPPPAIADSRSHTSRRGTRPRRAIIAHIPDSRSPPSRPGSTTVSVMRG